VNWLADPSGAIEAMLARRHNHMAPVDRRNGRWERKVEVVTPTERDELIRLRRENKQLRQERDVLAGAAPLTCGVDLAVQGGEDEEGHHVQMYLAEKFGAFLPAAGVAKVPGRPGRGVSWSEDAVKRYGTV
jgi:hypothetical protein